MSWNIPCSLRQRPLGQIALPPPQVWVIGEGGDSNPFSCVSTYLAKRRKKSFLSWSKNLHNSTKATYESFRLGIAKKRTWKTGTPEKPSSEIPIFSISYTHTKKKKSVLIYIIDILTVIIKISIVHKFSFIHTKRQTVR